MGIILAALLVIGSVGFTINDDILCSTNPLDYKEDVVTITCKGKE